MLALQPYFLMAAAAVVVAGGIYVSGISLSLRACSLTSNLVFSAIIL
jgi:hypothetical protein